MITTKTVAEIIYNAMQDMTGRRRVWAEDITTGEATAIERELLWACADALRNGRDDEARTMAQAARKWAQVWHEGAEAQKEFDASWIMECLRDAEVEA